MLEVLKRILSPEYLVVPDPGPMGSLWVLYAALGLLFAAGLAWAVLALVGRKERAQSTVGRGWAWYEFWVCLAGLAVVAGRFLGWPGWSARIWPYSLAALAVAGAVALRFGELRLAPWLAEQLRILALAPDLRGPSPVRSPRRKWSWLALGLAVHLAGLTIVVAARLGWPLWTAPLVLVCVLAVQAPLLWTHRPPRMMALTPLLGAYAATLLWLLYLWLGITVLDWQGLVFPNPMVSAFYLDGIILAAVAYTVLTQLAVASDSPGKHQNLWRGAVVGLLLCTLVWAGVVYLGKRTHGATASDPYAYAQMAVDLADHGTLLHRYELFPRVAPLGIAWAPIHAVGYHIPVNEMGDSPSVWATGASAILAVGYKLLGEVGLYVTTPLVALLALVATWALVQETLRKEPASVRYLTGAIAVALTATSPEHVDRLLVPMADAPAMLFTVLTLLFALRAGRRLHEGKRATADLILTGICFALAYWVRHTQLVLVIPIVVAVALGWRARKSPARHIAGSLGVVLGAALLAALPDIIYRWGVFGGPFATETTELAHMRLQYLATLAGQVLNDALVAGEWGYLFPFAIYGGYRLARRHPREAAVIGSAFGTVLLVHLTYRFLRLRDLISLFPLVNLAVGYGAVVFVREVRALMARSGLPLRLGAGLLPVVAVSWVILSLALSRWAMIDDVWKPGWASFGYMQPEERQAFERLEELVPPESVIAASLNAGAVAMYSGRDAVRPYDGWAGDEWPVFVDAMRADGRPVYLLDDGARMAEFIQNVDADTKLVPIEDLRVPLFEAAGRETGWLYLVEWDR